MGKPIVLIKRIILYGAGIFILAMGVAFSVKSNLGVSPVSSVPYVLSRIFPQSLGFWTVIFYLFCMVLQVVILRRDYKLFNLFQIAASFAFGYFTDLTLFIISFLPSTDNYIVRFIYLAVGIACIALGVLFYLTTALISLPTDGTVQAVTYKGRFKLHHVKIGYDCISTALAVTLSLIVLGDIKGIGIGTVIASLGVGRMLGLFSSLLKEKLEHLLGFEHPGAAASAKPPHEAA